MEKILEVKGLKKSFQKHFWSSKTEVLKGLDFFIPKGSVTGFLGTNGSGKTTTFKCLLQLIKKDAGEVRFFNKSDFNFSIKSRIGFLPEQPAFYEDLNLEELLLFYGNLSGSFSSKEKLKKRILFLIEKAGLLENRFQSLKTFSKGMIQKTGLIQCFLNAPDLVILDEPFSGLDPEGRYYAFSLIEEMKQEGQTVFLSSHILPDMEKLCDRIVVLKEGRIVFQGELEKLKEKFKGKLQIVFIEKGFKKNLSGLTFSECQSELQNLIARECSIASVEPEYQSLEEIYQKDSSIFINKE